MKKILAGILIVVAGLFMLSAPNVMAQGGPCESDFTCDGDVDADDVTTFLEDFGRSEFNNSCPDCYDSPCPCTICPYEMVDCGDKCVDPMTDREYCGVTEGCLDGTACGAGEICVGGVCDVPRPTCEGTLSAGGRWCDQLDGTVKDMTTGLVWLKKVDWGGKYPLWADLGLPDAHHRAAELWDGSPYEGTAGLSDGSSEGDWRLPTKNELVGIIVGTEYIRFSQMYFFTGVQPGNCWSGTSYASNPFYAWSVYMYDGVVFHTYTKYYNFFDVWPVRGGH